MQIEADTRLKVVSVLLISLVLLLTTATVVWRPYSTDMLRYAWWRIHGPGYTHGRIQSGNASIAYATTGSGPPLVLLHGGLSSSLDWYALIPALSQHFQLWLIDTRGHGASTLGVRTLGYDLLASDVIHVMDTLGLGRVDVAGWSDGGNAGLLLALHHPERVKRLVAISANAHPDGLTKDALASIQRIAVREPSLFSRILYRWQSPEHMALDRLRDEVTSMWQGDALLSDGELATIKTPTLLIIGEHDDIALEHAQDMDSLMPDSALEVIPGVGHNVPQAGSARLLASMLAFFRLTGDES
ncbi:alpha/beta fold hydrolase [bacterium]|nr:alpha/beta fold hydrolase [bacterium]